MANIVLIKYKPSQNNMANIVLIKYKPSHITGRKSFL